MPKIRVQYYAVFREARGLSQEELSTDTGTAGALYASLRQEHGFTLDPSLVRIAINGDFAEINAPLREGDRVVFIPPVAGG